MHMHGSTLSDKMGGKTFEEDLIELSHVVTIRNTVVHGSQWSIKLQDCS